MKRLVILSAIAGLLVTMLSPSWAAANLNLSKSNINRLCQGKPVGAVVVVEGRNEKCPAPPEQKPATKTMPDSYNK